LKSVEPSIDVSVIAIRASVANAEIDDQNGRQGAAAAEAGVVLQAVEFLGPEVGRVWQRHSAMDKEAVSGGR